MMIYDFRWDDKTQNPYFEIQENNILIQKELSPNTPISLTLKNQSLHCVGYKKNGEYVPCKASTSGTKKCEVCKKAEDYFPCQFCNGFNCDRFRNEKIENCDATHMVYLAFFASDIIKVGVSRMTREKARQFEQGSHFTQILARGISGITARRIEHFVGKLGFPDKIPATRKKDILFPEISLEEGKKILGEKHAFAKEHIHNSMPEMMKYIVDDEFWDMRAFYAESSEAFEALEKSSKALHFLDLEEGESIGGILKAIKGPFLIIETPTERAIILAKKLVGKEICFNPCEDGIVKNGGFQGGLF